ncbi:hypothetical protein OGAPHI_003656 [Ogataea philodendri]|uniref:Uncharacterized protein n=1 Tax=Ogataea philodendri TaxID=1378263 RepID=A0A9P8P5T0_9ASCO|nr:uncharacterized protein OGAPHI_003656 [Ogataea philodendri]KAH3665472.1 hypothetical protein OGAPHI_003656 [Ogataea philodendri]
MNICTMSRLASIVRSVRGWIEDSCDLRFKTTSELIFKDLSRFSSVADRPQNVDCAVKEPERLFESIIKDFRGERVQIAQFLRNLAQLVPNRSDSAYQQRRVGSRTQQVRKLGLDRVFELSIPNQNLVSLLDQFFHGELAMKLRHQHYHCLHNDVDVRVGFCGLWKLQLRKKLDHGGLERYSEFLVRDPQHFESNKVLHHHTERCGRLLFGQLQKLAIKLLFGRNILEHRGRQVADYPVETVPSDDICAGRVLFEMIDPDVEIRREILRCEQLFHKSHQLQFIHGSLLEQLDKPVRIGPGQGYVADFHIQMGVCCVGGFSARNLANNVEFVSFHGHGQRTKL